MAGYCCVVGMRRLITDTTPFHFAAVGRQFLVDPRLAEHTLREPERRQR